MKRVVFLLLLCLLATSVYAFDEQTLEQQYVNDLADVLSVQDEATITSFLEELESNSTVEFAVVTVDTLEGDDVFDASFRAAEYLGVGKSDVDNGLLIFVAVSDRAYFIQVGKGLEGAIPDILAGRVGDEVMAPHFREENYAQGIYDALVVFAGYALEDESVISDFESDYGSSTGDDIDTIWVDIIFFLLIIIIILASSYGRGRGGFIFLPGGFHHGRGRSGGFGGFGGGGFGGGGAGGRW